MYFIFLISIFCWSKQVGVYMRFDGRAFQGHGAGKQTAEGVEKKEAEEGVDDSRGGRTSRTDGGLWEILHVYAGEYQIKKSVLRVLQFD